MARLFICSAVLIAFVVAVRFELNQGFNELGFWPGIAICFGVAAFATGAAYVYDRAGSRSL